jgi:hypothetical protein
MLEVFAIVLPDGRDGENASAEQPFECGCYGFAGTFSCGYGESFGRGRLVDELESVALTHRSIEQSVGMSCRSSAERTRVSASTMTSGLGGMARSAWEWGIQVTGPCGKSSSSSPQTNA